MKKVIIAIVTFITLSTSVNAQSDIEELEFLQSIFGMNKKEFVDAFIDPKTETSETFWSIYDSYEAERKELGKNRYNLMVKYVENFDTSTDDQTNQMMSDIISLSKSSEKLIERYYKKMKKSVNATEAAEFYQIEAYILSAIRVEILNEIPFFIEYK